MELLGVLAALALLPHGGLAIYYSRNGNFDFTSAELSASVANYAVDSMTKCMSKCTAHGSCPAAVYDAANSRCYLYTSTRKMEFNPSSSAVLLTLTCDNVTNPTQDCCLHNDVLCGGPIYTDCQDAFDQGDVRPNGLYYLRPHSSWSETIKVICQFDSNSGWTVMQRRLDGSIDFYRQWDDFVSGFGNVQGEYWLGLNAIYWLTRTNRKISVYLEAHDGEVRVANYSTFYIDGSSDNYKVHVAGYSGNAGNSFLQSNSINERMFTTKDRDNDLSSSNCAVMYQGAWWYNTCHRTNLNGRWYKTGFTSSFATGTSWYDWKGHYYSYKTIYIRLSR